jgi:hypothetical protein
MAFEAAMPLGMWIGVPKMLRMVGAERGAEPYMDTASRPNCACEKTQQANQTSHR